MTMEDCLCVVVPCHNEDASLSYFDEAFCDVAAQLQDFGCELRAVFIDDGSVDGTLKELRRLCNEQPRYSYVAFSRNFGKEAGILAGIEEALSDSEVTLVGFMDADLQDPPSLLIDMYKTLCSEDCDTVAAYRETRAGEPPVRSACAHLFYKLINKMSDVEMRDGARDFKVMRRYVAEAVASMPERVRFSKGLFAWVGFDTRWVGYENVEREHGSTNWSFLSLVRYAVDGFLGFTVLPLEIISVIGLLVFLFSILFIIFIFVRALLFGDPVAGWPSLVCLITFLSGVQIMSVGFIGLYLSKVYTESKRRPLYIIKERS